MSSFCYWIGQSYDGLTARAMTNLAETDCSKATVTRKCPCISRSDLCISVGGLDRRELKNGQDLPMTKIRRRTTVLLALIDLSMQIA